MSIKDDWAFGAVALSMRVTEIEERIQFIDFELKRNSEWITDQEAARARLAHDRDRLAAAVELLRTTEVNP